MDFDELGNPDDDDVTEQPGHQIGHSLAEKEAYQMVLGAEVRACSSLLLFLNHARHLDTCVLLLHRAERINQAPPCCHSGP